MRIEITLQAPAQLGVDVVPLEHLVSVLEIAAAAVHGVEKIDAVVGESARRLATRLELCVVLLDQGQELRG